MNSMTSTGTNLGSVPRTNVQDRMRGVPVLTSTALPQTQAGFASWSSPALCPTPKRALNPMTPQRFSPIPQFDGGEESAASEAVNHGDHSDAHSRMSEGSRAINRLLLSLWFLLIPMIWPGSDWIGLIILSQAFLVAAKLIQ